MEPVNEPKIDDNDDLLKPCNFGALLLPPDVSRPTRLVLVVVVQMVQLLNCVFLCNEWSSYRL